jgi:Holliday junction resolvase RusA-like endonuclease
LTEIVLPYPPTVNTYWRHVGPRVLISRRGRAFRAKVRLILYMMGVRPLEGPLRVVIELHPPDNRRRDCDNAMKALLDALEHGGAYRDDSQVVRLEVDKCAATPRGKCIVRLEKR